MTTQPTPTPAPGMTPAAAARNRRRAAGRRLVQVLLTPAASTALTRAQRRHTGTTLVSLVSRAVLDFETRK